MRTGRGSGANCDESALCGIVLPPIDMNTPDYIGQLITCLSRIPIGAHTWIGVTSTLATSTGKQTSPMPASKDYASSYLPSV